MGGQHVNVAFYVSDPNTNRKSLFEDALLFAKHGKVLYILYDELEELPELSQDISLVNKHYMKMISFLYVKTVESLIESLTTLPYWQNVPSTIILDDLSQYCNKDRLQNACGITAFLIDSARSCSNKLDSQCRLRISVNHIVGEDYCNTLKELYLAINK